jgi:hypothetical protein
MWVLGLGFAHGRRGGHGHGVRSDRRKPTGWALLVVTVIGIAHMVAGSRLIIAHPNGA